MVKFIKRYTWKIRRFVIGLNNIQKFCLALLTAQTMFTILTFDSLGLWKLGHAGYIRGGELNGFLIVFWIICIGIFQSKK